MSRFRRIRWLAFAWPLLSEVWQAPGFDGLG
jgi:hypothetical protein